MTRGWLIRSAGTRLEVKGAPHLGRWWPILSAQIPGVCGPPADGHGGPDALRINDSAGPADTRRIINAGLHVGHLGTETLSVHGVAVAKAGQAMLLIGDHGAGKSLTALGMIQSMGWSPVAGDTCLVRLDARGVAVVVGGTRAFVVRRADVTRWFPALAFAEQDGELVDLAVSLPGFSGGAPRLAGIVMVAVDGGAFGSPPVACDERVAMNALCRASGHLLAKVLDDAAADPLSLLESPDLVRRRMQLVRLLASTVRCWWARGTPDVLAAAVESLAREGASRG
ncbi:hypothetical protein Ga0074812_14328 [Parafrankia irregularis]|uniref:HPr Serine kinase C-terminal domain-containing protein n=1 Tax=Parafrankia irregularis TaxID=795642 RepID=A0A0S4QYP1_9ACTN|nr:MULTISPECIES: hypothetical protein [Frankiaceae]MBE3204673.1 hypothetical protein [Parafrankia sp. CH37]CUU60611.1 hypothetical protein Ga0074812_14328 [Parafrankia irregularis]